MSLATRSPGPRTKADSKAEPRKPRVHQGRDGSRHHASVPVVILSAAKDPWPGRPDAMRARAARAGKPGVLRCAQDDNG